LRANDEAGPLRAGGRSTRRLERTPWGALETGAIDPFGNLIRFCELIDKR
jgi:hypothetical protein